MTAAYVPYTAALGALDAAQITLTEWRDVADAYAAQVLQRRAAWESAPDPESFDRYQDAVHQYRAAQDKVRLADADLAHALKERAHERPAA